MAQEAAVDNQLSSSMKYLNSNKVFYKRLSPYLPGVKFTDVLANHLYYKKALIFAAKISCLEFSKSIILTEFVRFFNEITNGKCEQHSLINAIEKADFVIVEKLLQQNENKFILAFPLGYNLINVSLFFGCSSTFLVFLINRLADMNCVNCDNAINGVDTIGLTPLISSVLAGNTECIRQLMILGANVNDRDKPTGTKSVRIHDDASYKDDLLYGHVRTALMYASCIGNVNHVELILEYKPRLDVICAKGINAFGYAALTSNISCLRSLLNLSTKVIPQINHSSFCFKQHKYRTGTNFDQQHNQNETLQDNESKSNFCSTVGTGLNVENKFKSDKQSKFDFNFNADLFPKRQTQENEIKVQVGFSIGAFDKSKSDFRLKAKQKQKRQTSRRSVEDSTTKNVVNNTFFIGTHKALSKEEEDRNPSASQVETAINDSIQYAILGGNKECLEALLDHCSNDFDINGLLRNGKSPLILASEKNKTDCLQLLLVRGVEVDKAHSFSEGTALTFASQNGNLECLKLLLKHKASLELQNKYNETALVCAIRFGQVDSMMLLLQHGADVEAKSRNNESALMLAVKLKHWDCFEILLEHGACVDCKDIMNDSPLSIITQNGKIDYLNILLKYKPDLNAILRNNTTALISAVFRNKIEIVSILLEHGAKINICDYTGKNALCYSIRWNKTKCFELIIQELMKRENDSHGLDIASLNTGPQSNETNLFQFGHEGKKSDISKSTNDLRKDSISELAELALPHSLPTGEKYFNWLLPYCHFLNHVDDKEKTALMHAAECGKFEFVQKLIHKNVNVNFVNKRGQSAISFAALCGHAKCLELLLENGGNPDNGLHDGLHALYLAVGNQDFECVNLLIKHKANVNRLTKNGKSAMMWTLFGMTTPDNKILKVLSSAGGKIDIIDFYALPDDFKDLLCDLEMLKFVLQKKILVKEKKLSNSTRFRLPEFYNEANQMFWAMNLLMEYDMFDWSVWCTHYGKDIVGFVFLAVQSRLPLGQVRYNNNLVSVLQAALLASDENIVKYLLSNLYITWGDYQCITNNQSFREQISKSTFLEKPNFNKLFNNPWRLEYLCLLRISTSLLNQNQNESKGLSFKLKRDEMVNSLSIPNTFKNVLKFDLQQSRLCPKQWRRIGKCLTPNNTEDILSITKPLYPMNLTVSPCGAFCDYCFSFGMKAEYLDVCDDIDWTEQIENIFGSSSDEGNDI